MADNQSSTPSHGSDKQEAPGWWMASDYRWYPPELHPDYKKPSLPAPPAAESSAASGSSVDVSSSLDSVTASSVTADSAASDSEVKAESPAETPGNAKRPADASTSSTTVLDEAALAHARSIAESQAKEPEVEPATTPVDERSEVSLTPPAPSQVDSAIQQVQPQALDNATTRLANPTAPIPAVSPQPQTPISAPLSTPVVHAPPVSSPAPSVSEPASVAGAPVAAPGPSSQPLAPQGPPAAPGVTSTPSLGTPPTSISSERSPRGPAPLPSPAGPPTSALPSVGTPNNDPFIEPTEKETKQKSTVAGVLACLGGLLAIVGSFLSWAAQTINRENGEVIQTTTVSGFNSQGFFTLIGGILVLAAGVMFLTGAPKQKLWAAAAFVGGAICVALVAYGVVDIMSLFKRSVEQFAASGSALANDTRTENWLAGIWLSGIGGVLGVLATPFFKNSN